jgi:hypothetical protein
MCNTSGFFHALVRPFSMGDRAGGAARLAGASIGKVNSRFGRPPQLTLGLAVQSATGGNTTMATSRKPRTAKLIPFPETSRERNATTRRALAASIDRAIAQGFTRLTQEEVYLIVELFRKTDKTARKTLLSTAEALRQNHPYPGF